MFFQREQRDVILGGARESKFSQDLADDRYKLESTTGTSADDDDLLMNRVPSNNFTTLEPMVRIDAAPGIENRGSIFWMSAGLANAPRSR